MKQRHLKLLIRILVATIIQYLVYSFIAADFNPFNYDIAARFLIAFLWIISSGFIIVLEYDL